jgi:hypothetical protein
MVSRSHLLGLFDVMLRLPFGGALSPRPRVPRHPFGTPCPLCAAYHVHGRVYAPIAEAQHADMTERNSSGANQFSTCVTARRIGGTSGIDSPDPRHPPDAAPGPKLTLSRLLNSYRRWHLHAEQGQMEIASPCGELRKSY